MPRKDFESTPQSANITYGRADSIQQLELSIQPQQPGHVEDRIAAAEERPAAVAVLVCHGMGQQVRYETIGQLAASILTEAKRQGCTIHSNGVEMSYQNDDFLARAELNWTDPDRQPHQVHIYEAYWAPITEGKVTYIDTILFLLQAARSGIGKSRFLRPAVFSRWMFGSMQTLKIGAPTQVSLFGVAAFLLLQVALIAMTLAKLADQLKQIEATHFALKQVLFILLPGMHTLHNPALSASQHWLAILALLGWYLLVAEVLFVRHFLIEYAGDVAAYISPYKDSKFDSIRHQIQAIGLNVAKVIYGFSDTTVVPDYERVVVVGHSLGSVLAYDTLNAIIACDETSSSPRGRRVVERTRHLITFGSPLDKTAFLFRNQSNHIQDPLREQMVAASQPLIQNYKNYRRFLTWTNLWSRKDVISGSLGYYDADHVTEEDPIHVQNKEDPAASIPFYAHVQYWTGQLLASVLYDAVSQPAPPSGSPVQLEHSHSGR
jgi:hypothetical protein